MVLTPWCDVFLPSSLVRSWPTLDGTAGCRLSCIEGWVRVILQQPVQRVHGVFPISKPAILLPTATYTHHVLLLQHCLASLTGLSPGWHTHGHSGGLTDQGSTINAAWTLWQNWMTCQIAFLTCTQGNWQHRKPVLLQACGLTYPCPSLSAASQAVGHLRSSFCKMSDPSYDCQSHWRVSGPLPGSPTHLSHT